MPSHQTSPSSVSATLVKMQFLVKVNMALRLEFIEVPGATPKNPASGLMARRVPSDPGLIQAMSSPMVVTFQLSKPFGGIRLSFDRPSPRTKWKLWSGLLLVVWCCCTYQPTVRG